MYLKKLIQGLLAAGVINVCVAEIPAIAMPVEQPIAQADTKKSNQITEADIRKVLAEMQVAIEKKDLEGILKFIAPFAYSEVTVESGSGKMTVNLEGKDDHRILLTEAGSQIQKRRTIRNRTDIRISPDGELGTATIFRVREYTTQNGRRFLSAGTDTLRFAMFGKQPMVVSATLQGWLAERPLLKPQQSGQRKPAVDSK